MTAASHPRPSVVTGGASGIGRMIGGRARACHVVGIALPVDAGWLLASSWPTHGGLQPARA